MKVKKINQGYRVVGNKIVIEKSHGFHLVLNSPWPIITGIGIMSIMLEIVSFLQEIVRSNIYLYFNITLFLIVILRWASDISVEGSYEGNHTKIIQKMLSDGFFLFIGSEVMFFGAMFGSYIYTMAHPSIWIGAEWPPSELFEMNPLKLPLANAFLLVASGLWGEVAHLGITLGLAAKAIHFIQLLVFLGVAFVLVQFHEYVESPFGMDDSIYGSLFFFITGFHGTHVILGLLLVIIQYFRLNIGCFTRNHHLGFNFSIWYWHFVDIIWIFSLDFLFIFYLLFFK
jgi:heme/copper-type cytochrome/quinol oxidase subunit 3